jgi:murein DD-endopeptidase MepM/ murein hydrolase activator NlpD
VPQFLTLPFDASNKKIVLQRAWTTRDPNTGAFTLLHHAIDYVNGTRDVPSTWKTFDVLAAAEGDACGAKTGQTGCFDDGEIMGNRVLIKHKVEGTTYYTFYNHLATIAQNIPLNNVKNTVHVSAGDVIGQAGDSNSPGVLHLHFELLDENMKPIDPYGIYGVTDQYPDPRGKNGKDAGKKNYFLTDPPQPFGFKVKPSDTPTATEASVETASPTSATGSGAIASASPSTAVTPSPLPTATVPPALATVPPPSPPASGGSGGTGSTDSGGGGMNVVPIVLGVGAVLIVGVIIGAIGLSRRSRNPLPRDRWRP